MWDAVTGGLVYVRYVRLHGHSRLYRSRYATGTLEFRVRRVRRWLREGCEVHVHFDNDAEGHAPWDALRLKGLLGAARPFRVDVLLAGTVLPRLDRAQ